jgi:Ca2+-transporting ATPase
MHTSHTSPFIPHTRTVQDVLKELQTSEATGLSQEEATKRLLEHGPNELTASKQIHWWELLLEQLKNMLVIILIIAVALSAFLGHEVEAIAIGVIVLFAVLLGFIQEFRAEKAMEKLRAMAAPAATVIRDGAEKEIPAKEVVPGDIVILKTGDKIPADGRLIEAVNLKADEASLTGESVATEKHTDPLSDPALSAGDKKNMVFAGTAATYGRGKFVVTSTGMHTEFGKIAGLLQTVKTEDTPLQKNLDLVGKRLAQIALVIVVIISVLGFYRGEPLLEIFIFGIALAVAVVPEALPAVVTISLAIGVQRMVKRHALIRRLPAVETLGSTTVICSDKTGTLTKDEMTIRQIWTDGDFIDVSGAGYEPTGQFSIKGQKTEPSSTVLELLQGGVLSSDAKLTKEGDMHDIKGDPTEGAFVVAAAKANMFREELDKAFPRVGEIPFSSETKRMTTLHKGESGHVAYAKGAVEIVLESCTRKWGKHGEEPLADEDRKKILDAAKEMAKNAMRVLAVARKGGSNLKDAEGGMKFLGLVGMIDPPRKEAKDAIRLCKQAGIKVVMITGDHPVTAEAIARELGLLTTEKVVTGAELEKMDETTFDREVESIGVYARVSPAHKLRVVGALQKKGHIVAMTGDGVNDAPALKKADIGIAMGITGTDVTKEAAAMTLTDDNFASIVAAIEEGRGIFGNIKKYLMYLLSANIGEIGLMTGATILGLPLPLSAVQILYINLATDGLPALALAVDPPEKDLMNRPPRNPRVGIFTRPVVLLMIIGGMWSMLANLSLFHWSLLSGKGESEAMTMCFLCLVLIEFFKAYSFRSDRHSIIKGMFSNTWLNTAIGWEFVLLMFVVYLPILHIPFDTFSLPLEDWLVLLPVAFSIIPVLEIAKWMVRHGWFGKVV